MPQQPYHGIFLRDLISDSGLVPASGKECLSPDIIPAQQRVITAQELVQSYSRRPIDTNINIGQANNIYARAKNNGGDSPGTMKLYYAESSLLMTPNLWVNNPIQTVSGADSVQIVTADGGNFIPTGQIGVGQEPFSFTPVRVPPDGYHFCFVGQLDTPAHPAYIPGSFMDIEDFAIFLLATPGIGMRNVHFLPAGLSSYQQRASFTNINQNASQYFFIVSGGYWPDQTTVNIQCMSPDLPFSFTQQFTSSGQVISMSQTLPGKFSGDLLVTLTPPPGVTVPTNAAFDVRFGIVVDGPNEKKLKKFSRTAASLGVKGEFKYVKLVLVGSCATYLDGGQAKTPLKQTRKR